jgi:hypothetical protein
VQIVREACAKAMADPELLSDAKKGKMEVEPVTGEELERLAGKMIDQPPQSSLKKILGKTSHSRRRKLNRFGHRH